MRNLILSAYPQSMRPPDPFTPNLKVDLLPEIKQPPIMAVGVDSLLPRPLQMDIDIFLHTRQNAAFPTELKNQFMLPLSESASTGSRYNVSQMNALILYLGIQANAKVPMIAFETRNVHFFFFGLFIHEFFLLFETMVRGQVAQAHKWQRAHPWRFSAGLLKTLILRVVIFS